MDSTFCLCETFLVPNYLYIVWETQQRFDSNWKGRGTMLMFRGLFQIFYCNFQVYHPLVFCLPFNQLWLLMLHPGIEIYYLFKCVLKIWTWLSNTCTAAMNLNMMIRGLAVKNITDKMNSIDSFFVFLGKPGTQVSHIYFSSIFFLKQIFIIF